MPSRRNKKQDKSKARAAKKEEWMPGLVPGIWKQDCDHGCTLPSAADTDCQGFFDAYLQARYGGPQTRLAEVGVIAAREMYPKLLDDPSSREKVKGLFLKFAVDLALSNEEPSRAASVLDALTVIDIPKLEHVKNIVGDPDNDFAHPAYFTRCSRALARIILLDPGCRDLEVVRDLSSRISCSCLDAKKAQQAKLKKKQTTAICTECKQEIGLERLLVCGECKIANYCSKECQVADWPRHRIYCKIACVSDDMIASWTQCKCDRCNNRSNQPTCPHCLCESEQKF